MTESVELRTIGVIGAGVMGTGVAHDLARCGLQVILVDESAAALTRSEAQIRRDIRFAGMFGKPGASAAGGGVLERITFTRDLQAVASADFVIENVTEKWEVKAPVFRALDEICAQACVLASNTSAISVTRSGSVTRRPDRVLGMHFMNPVPLIATVEVIRGFHTSEATLARANELLARLGKQAVVVQDAPGFVSNRVLMLTVNEAIWVVQDGVSNPEDVDRLFRECMGYRMGPIATADLIGLDTILYSLEALQEQTGDPKFRPCPLLRKLVDAGRLGAKSGQGFYAH